MTNPPRPPQPPADDERDDFTWEHWAFLGGITFVAALLAWCSGR